MLQPKILAPSRTNKTFIPPISVRRIIFTLLGVMAVIILIPAGVLGPYALRVQHFGADPARGYHADFYLYVSPTAQHIARAGEQVTILVQPNNSGISSDDVDVHRKDAWWTGFERRKIADELGVMLLVPAFIRPGEDWHIYTHALDRDSLITERPDLKRIGLHTMWDFANDGIFGVGVAGQSGESIKGLLQASLSGPTLLTGSELGVEASMVSLLIVLAAGVILLQREYRKRQFSLLNG